MPGEKQITEVLEGTALWQRLAALGAVLLLAGVTWLVAHWLMTRLRGATRLGLQRLDRTAAPLALLVAIGVGAAGRLAFPSYDLPLLESILELLAIAGGFWLVARLLEVAAATGQRSARLRAQPAAVAALLAARRLGKLVVALIGATVLAVRLGAAERLYLVLGALGAALAFAAREPIQNVFAFVELLLDPPFHLGDRVRLVDFRGGEACEGEVVRLALTSITICTGRRTLLSLPNAAVFKLRIENLSAADRRRLELAVPVAATLSAEELRAACDAIERDLRDSPYVTDKRRPHVWISGVGDGLQLKVSAWLRKAAHRRDAQREVLLAIRARLNREAARA